MLWKKIIIFILLVGSGFNLGAVVMLGKELRFARFSLMMVLLILALFVAYSEQKTSKRKVDNLRQKLTEKEKIITDAQEKLNKLIKSIKV
mgnify:FL=1